MIEIEIETDTRPANDLSLKRLVLLYDDDPPVASPSTRCTRS